MNKLLTIVLIIFLTACAGDDDSSSSSDNENTVFRMWDDGADILNFHGLVKDINFPYHFQAAPDVPCVCDIKFIGYNDHGNLIISACTGDWAQLGYTVHWVEAQCRDTFQVMLRYEVSDGSLTLTNTQTGLGETYLPF